MSEHEELENTVAAWVLGATDSAESASMGAHVEGCPSCSVMAARLSRAVNALPLEVDEINPPARLRERILAAAAASPRSVAAPGRIKAAPRPTRRWFGGRASARVPLYAAAAAVMIALLIGAAAGSLGSRSPAPPPSQVARFSLTGHDGLSGARASVIDLKADGFTLVDFSGLPALATGRVYELWLVTRDGRADPAAVFVPDADGSKVVVVNRPLDGYVTMAVTNEKGPDGTSSPTQQPQLYGSLG